MVRPPKGTALTTSRNDLKVLGWEVLCPGYNVSLRRGEDPFAGSLVGDLVRRHPGSRVTAVPCGPARQGRLDHLALVEGIPPFEVAQLLLAWNMRYGVPAEVLGDPFALRLPVLVPAAIPPWNAILAASQGLTVGGNVIEGEHVEQWIQCADAAQAQRVAGLLRALVGHSQAELIAGPPRSRDLECWAILRQAVELDDPAAPTAGDGWAATPA